VLTGVIGDVGQADVTQISLQAGFPCLFRRGWGDGFDTDDEQNWEQLGRLARTLAAEDVPEQDQLADGPGSRIRMPFGVHRLASRRYGFYTVDGSPLAPSIREQIYALKTSETVPETDFEAY